MLFTKAELRDKLLNNRSRGSTSSNIRKILHFMMECHKPQPQVFEENKFCIYTSGKIGNYYLQSAVNLTNGDINALCVLEMCRMILSDYPDWSNLVISGGESRDWIVSYAVAAFLRLPHLSIYKYKKGNEKKSKIIGADEKDIEGKKVIHVADLNNMGSSVVDMWVPKIESMGSKIEKTYFIIDRMEEGVKVLEKMSMPSQSLIKMDEHTWSYLEKCDYITPSQLKSIEARLHDECKWSLRVLEENPQRIVELNKIQPERVEKMMEVYSDHPELFKCINK